MKTNSPGGSRSEFADLQRNGATVFKLFQEVNRGEKCSRRRPGVRPGLHEAGPAIVTGGHVQLKYGPRERPRVRVKVFALLVLIVVVLVVVIEVTLIRVLKH